MKTNIYNRQAPVISQEVTTAIKKAISEAFANLPGLVGIPAEDRKTIVKINVSNKVFAEDALAAGMSRPEVLPAYLSMEELQNRLGAYDAYDSLIGFVDELGGKLRDAQTMAGSEAYVAALAVYHCLEQARKNGAPGLDAVCMKLGERFKGQGSNGAAKSE